MWTHSTNRNGFARHLTWFVYNRINFFNDIKIGFVVCVFYPCSAPRNVGQLAGGKCVTHITTALKMKRNSKLVINYKRNVSTAKIKNQSKICSQELQTRTWSTNVSFIRWCECTSRTCPDLQFRLYFAQQNTRLKSAGGLRGRRCGARSCKGFHRFSSRHYSSLRALPPSPKSFSRLPWGLIYQ